ncbi:MAG: hypothetical protein AB1810_08180 [Pseudomonadota bacterium]
MSRQIASATEEQSAVANEMNANIMDIRNTSEGMGQLTQSSRQLCQMSEHLQNNMARFKL